MIQKVFYGNTVSITANAVDANSYVKWTLIILVIIVLATGVFPQPLLHLTRGAMLH